MSQFRLLVFVLLTVSAYDLASIFAANASVDLSSECRTSSAMSCPKIEGVVMVHVAAIGTSLLTAGYLTRRKPSRWVLVLTASICGLLTGLALVSTAVLSM